MSWGAFFYVVTPLHTSHGRRDRMGHGCPKYTRGGMLEPLLHARLQDKCADLVGGSSGAFSPAFAPAFPTESMGRVYPVKASENTAVPHIVYSVTSTEPLPGLRGDIATEYTCTVDSYALTFPEVLAIASRIRDGLHRWQSAEVIGSFMTDGASELDELGYAYSQDFKIKVRE